MFNILILIVQLVLYSSCFEITRVSDVKSFIGVSPFYDAEKNSIIYADGVASFINKPVIFRHDLATNKTYSAIVDGLAKNTRLGFVIPFEDSEDLYAFSANGSLEIVKWNGLSPIAKIVCTQVEIEPIETNVVHSAHIDTHGRMWTGAIRKVLCNPKSSSPPGRYLMSTDGNTFEPVIENLLVANDFMFDRIRNKIYYGDSCKYLIKSQDIDPKSGALSNERVVYDDTKSPDGTPTTFPDGIVVDTDGNLWVAGNGQSVFYKVDPITGIRSNVMHIPSKYVQAATFGGPNYDTIYVTTSQAILDGNTGGFVFQSGPNEGYLYKITGLGVKGQPESKINMRFASCVNDITHKKKHGFRAKLKKIGKKVKEIIEDVF